MIELSLNPTEGAVSFRRVEVGPVVDPILQLAKEPDAFHGFANHIKFSCKCMIWLYESWIKSQC